jgi:hypothetical protein
MSRRFEPRPRRDVRLTPRDLCAVEAVFEARYMSGRQLARLLFGREDASHARQRLRYLYDLDYLRKRVAAPHEADIYYLGLQGRRYVATLGGWSRAQVDRIAGVSGEEVAAPALMMRHELTLARLYVEARLECAARGWELTWRNTRMLELERLGIEPDAWLGVGAGEGGQEAFVEFTAAMPGAAELANKLARYQAHWEGTRRPAAVLWLTTSRARAHRLLDAVRAVAYRDYFLVGLIEDTGRFITRPMWRWGAGEGVWGDVVSWMQAPAE